MRAILGWLRVKVASSVLSPGIDILDSGVHVQHSLGAQLVFRMLAVAFATGMTLSPTPAHSAEYSGSLAPFSLSDGTLAVTAATGGGWGGVSLTIGPRLPMSLRLSRLFPATTTLTDDGSAPPSFSLNLWVNLKGDFYDNIFLEAGIGSFMCGEKTRYGSGSACQKLMSYYAGRVGQKISWGRLFMRYGVGVAIGDGSVYPMTTFELGAHTRSRPSSYEPSLSEHTRVIIQNNRPSAILNSYLLYGADTRGVNYSGDFLVQPYAFMERRIRIGVSWKRGKGEDSLERWSVNGIVGYQHWFKDWFAGFLHGFYGTGKRLASSGACNNLTMCEPAWEESTNIGLETGINLYAGKLFSFTGLVGFSTIEEFHMGIGIGMDWRVPLVILSR